MNRILVVAIVAAFVGLASGCAQTTNSNMMANANNVNHPMNANAMMERKAGLTEADRSFMTEAAQGGMMEVELGRWAAQHAANADVKKFGQRMVDDHSKANDELKQLAAGKNMTLPTDINADQKSTRDKLTKLTGAAFDKEYMKDMVNDHEEDVKKFADEQTGASDPDLKAFVTKTVPVLREHLQLAHDAAKKVGAE